MKAELYRINGQNGRGAVIVKINALPVDCDIDVILRKHDKVRTKAQNRLMWKWLKHLKIHLSLENGLVTEEERLKESFSDRVWGQDHWMDPLTGEERSSSKSTTKATVAEMSALLSEIDRYSCGCGLYLPHPDDLGIEELANIRRAA